ncbi:unnamed protein product [Ranitomeya imitator]|uniref:Protein kinase domain-containing protein n=1 Tax=Ranitomeya imitator TaxID=111125 RepID=A0ABN9LK58_9NEOB|nr:unnamed protein product [Ranitomeya imitator]
MSLMTPERTPKGRVMPPTYNISEKQEINPGLGTRGPKMSLLIKTRRCLDAGECQDPNNLQKTPVDTGVLKRKREEDHVEGKRSDTGGEGIRPCNNEAKRPKPDTNFCPVAGDDSLQSDDILPTVPDSLSVESFTYHKVLLASEKVSGHQLAIKILQKRRLLKERRTTEANKEKLLLQIAEQSPFLCASYATFQTSDYLFYVMDYMAGGDLHHLIKNKAPFDIETTRDLKPLNIFIDSGSHVRIGDFGLAKINLLEDQKVSGYAGTRRYMAPEVFRREKFDRAVDWFSLGIILYQMSSGNYPFYNGKDRMNLKMSILWDEPIYPQDLNPKIKDMINNTLVQDDVIPFVTMLNTRKPRGPPITPEEQRHFIDFSNVSCRGTNLQPKNLGTTTSNSTGSSVQGALVDNLNQSSIVVEKLLYHQVENVSHAMPVCELASV